jgi:antirestriction protein ArdC
MSESVRGDVYERITQAIVDALEAGTRPWLRPWQASSPMGGNGYLPLRTNGMAYRGVNVLVLWATAAAKGYTNPYWVTFKQAQADGGNVRKGERGTFICYANRIIKKEQGENGEDVERVIPLLKGYTVFNVCQCDNMPEKYFRTPAKVEHTEKERIATADSAFAATGATIKHGGDRAFYSPSLDFVQMPHFEDFTNAESHAATLAHELVHWSSHPTRLNRSFGVSRFGNEAYAVEELVAEIGAAFVCASLQITSEVMPNHAAYVASWLKVLKNDKKFIFTAASHAQKAADYLLAFSGNSANEDESGE